MVRQGTSKRAGKRGTETLYQANGVAAGWVSNAFQVRNDETDSSRESHFVPDNEKTQAMTGESGGTSPVPDADLSHLYDKFWNT